MEILGIQRPFGIIAREDTIKICPHCNTILKYTDEDIWVKSSLKGIELKYMTCMSCKKDIHMN